MVSPGDATPATPQDVQPDEMDVAVLADWIERGLSRRPITDHCSNPTRR